MFLRYTFSSFQDGSAVIKLNIPSLGMIYRLSKSPEPRFVQSNSNGEPVGLGFCWGAHKRGAPGVLCVRFDLSGCHTCGPPFPSTNHGHPQV